MALFRRRVEPVDTDALALAVADRVKALAPQPGQWPAPQSSDAVYVQRTFGQGGMFNPGRPFTPQGIDPREPEFGGIVPPRRTEFTVSVNNQLNDRIVPFDILRKAADSEVPRACIKVRKAQILALDWDVLPTRRALKRIMLTEGITSAGQASKVLRNRYEPEMLRLADWWETPDPIEGLDFGTWLGMLLEEVLVTDALTIWPRRNLGGGTVALEILDGATIKPLLDHRGARPLAPAPAFQQILYGFPRGNFTAADNPDAQYQADELYYRPKVRRTWTPYGQPDTEVALMALDLYLKRSTWLRQEFDAATPTNWILPDAASTLKPEQIIEYVRDLNNLMGANTLEQHKLVPLPPGWKSEDYSSFADRYQGDLDEYAIKLLCMAYDVMPTEAGFPPKGGIGGKGHQEGEANSSQRKAVRPTATWLQSLLTQISRSCLGMPPELEFRFMGYEIEDQNAEEEVTSSIMKRGGLTINEDRAARGEILWEFPEADVPFVTTPTGLVFLPGAIAAQAAAAQVSADAKLAASQPSTPDPTDTPKDRQPPVNAPKGETGTPSQQTEPTETAPKPPDGHIAVAAHTRRKPGAEAVKFQTFATKRIGRTWRDFAFEDVPAGMAEALNAAGRAGDIELVKSLVAECDEGSQS